MIQIGDESVEFDSRILRIDSGESRFFRGGTRSDSRLMWSERPYALTARSDLQYRMEYLQLMIKIGLIWKGSREPN